MTRRAPLVVLLAVLAVAVGAPPAAGAARATDADRAAAREFSFAVYRLRVAVKGLAPEVARREAELRSARCGGGPEPVPRRVAGEVRAAYIAAYGWVFSDVFRPAVVTFMAELDRVPVTDRALRRGRAAWRRSAEAVRDLPAPPPDLCEQFARWRDAGYAPAARPAIPIGSVEAGDADLAAWQGRLDAAARRMRALGVSPSAARRFTGRNLFAGLPGASGR